MTDAHFIGIDLGTLDVRGVLVTAEGTVKAEVHHTLNVHSPAPGACEHNPEKDWWQSSRMIIQQLLATENVSPASVEGVGVAGLFPSACFLDEQSDPIGNALLYSDNRASHLLSWVSDVVGQPLKGDETIPRLLWLAQERQEIFERIKKVLTPTGYVVFRLTGRMSIDPHNASRMGGVVKKDGDGWRQDVLDDLEIPAEIFPESFPLVKVVGGVSERAAQDTGLKQGTPVITGTTDTLAALVGSGVQEIGEAMIYYGSSCTLSVVTVPFAEAVVGLESFGIDAPYQLAVYLPSSGAILRWAFDLFTSLQEEVPPQDTVFEKLDAAAAHIDPGAEGLFVLPYFSGRFFPRPDSQASGHIAGLKLNHSIGHVWRALLEAPGYVIADRLRHPLPHQMKRMWASGGGARSKIWRGIISNISGIPQYYAPEGSGALGIAFLAAFGTGHVSRFSTLSEEWLQSIEVTEPDEQVVASYLDKKETWRRLDLAAGYSQSPSNK